MFEMEIEMFDAMDDDFMFWGLGSAQSTQHTAGFTTSFSISVRFHSSRFSFQLFWKNLEAKISIDLVSWVRSGI